MRCHECKHWVVPTDPALSWLRNAVEEGYRPEELPCKELKYVTEIEIEGDGRIELIWTNRYFFCAAFETSPYNKPQLER